MKAFVLGMDRNHQHLWLGINSFEPLLGWEWTNWVTVFRCGSREHEPIPGWNIRNEQVSGLKFQSMTKKLLIYSQHPCWFSSSLMLQVGGLKRKKEMWRFWLENLYLVSFICSAQSFLKRNRMNSSERYNTSQKCLFTSNYGYGKIKQKYSYYQKTSLSKLSWRIWKRDSIHAPPSTKHL